MGSFSVLKQVGVSLDKVIFTIELKIESIRVVDAEDMGYSYVSSLNFTLFLEVLSIINLDFD